MSRLTGIAMLILVVFGAASTSMATRSLPDSGDIFDSAQVAENLTSGSFPPRLKIAAVYGTDDRFEMKLKAFPWIAIGKLRLDSRRHCTATLISQCHILTAAHCVSTKDKKAVDMRNLSFEASNGGPTANVVSTRYGYYGLNRADDWAVLKLDRNLGKELGWFGVMDKAANEIPRSLKLTLAGYSVDIGDLGQIATVDPNVQVKFYEPSNSGDLYHNANSAGGSSGGALFFLNPKGLPVIVAVNTGAILRNSDSAQIYYEQDTEELTKLARGVATHRFFAEMLRFQQSSPCEANGQ